MPLILTSSRAWRRPKTAPALPPSSDFTLVNSRTGIQFTTGASTITEFASGTVWGGTGGTNPSAFSMVYRNAIISKGPALNDLTVVETRDYSTREKDGWFDNVESPGQGDNWTTDGTDCTATFPSGLLSGSGAHDESYAISSPQRAGRVDFAFTLASDYSGHSSGFNKLMWLYPNGLARAYVDIHGSGAGPYTLNINVQGTVNPGTTNFEPNIVLGASIERGVAVTLRYDILGNTNGAADGELHLSYKLG